MISPENKFEKMIKEPDAFKCNECGHAMEYKGAEIYQCTNCDNQYLTEYGQIRKYLEENGACSMMELANGTGIKLRKIQEYISDGQLSIAPGIGRTFPS